MYYRVELNEAIIVGDRGSYIYNRMSECDGGKGGGDREADRGTQKMGGVSELGNV